MSGMLSKALSALFKENEDLTRNARALGEAATMRIHRKQHAVDMSTGESKFTWQIDFSSKDELESFHNAVAGIIDLVSGDAGEQ